MAQWLDEGRELNGLAAVVIIWLFTHLSISHFPLQDIGQGQLQPIIDEYMFGFDTYTRTLTLNYRMELLMWKGFLPMSVNATVAETATANTNTVSVVGENVLERIRDLEVLVEKGASGVLKEIKGKVIEKRKKSLCGYYRECQVFREMKVPSSALSSSSYSSSSFSTSSSYHTLYRSRYEPLLYDMVRNIEGNSKFFVQDEGAQNYRKSLGDSIYGLKMSGDWSNKLGMVSIQQFGAVFKSFGEDYLQEKNEGAKQLRDLWNDATLNFKVMADGLC